MEDLAERLRTLADDYPMSSRQIAVAEWIAEDIDRNPYWRNPSYQRARQFISEVTGEMC